MQLDVIASVNEVKSDDFVNKTIVVMDVLRATSTMITALHNGCLEVIPVETVSQAKSMQEPGYLLGGERFGKKISGFEFGNSPLEYVSEKVLGKTLIMTTTNGTRAVQKSQKAANIVACSFLNLASSVKAVQVLKRDVVIVCAGTQDQYSLEDGLCAGAFIEEYMNTYQDCLEIGDFGTAMLLAYKQCKNFLTETLLSCVNGRRLIKMGLKDDVLYCSRLNISEVVPYLVGCKMVPFEF